MKTLWHTEPIFTGALAPAPSPKEPRIYYIVHICCANFTWDVMSLLSLHKANLQQSRFTAEINNDIVPVMQSQSCSTYLTINNNKITCYIRVRGLQMNRKYRDISSISILSELCHDIGILNTFFNMPYRIDGMSVIFRYFSRIFAKMQLVNRTKTGAN